MEQIIKNLFSLSLSELVAKILGLFTAAYLARVINPEGFGIINFATAFSSYFLIMATFGLDTYGNREIASHLEKRHKVVIDIFSLKILLSAIIFFLYISIVLFINNNFIVKGVLLINGFNIFINATNFNWYFQAVEKMGFVAARQITTSLLTLGGVILLVHSEDSILIAAGISVIAGGLNSFFFILVYQKLTEKLKFVINIPVWHKILKESFPLFFSTFMVTIYYNLDTIMIGYMKSQNEVGIYSAAYKILLIGIIPLGIIQRAFFPPLSRIGLKKDKEFSSLIKNYFLFLFFVGITCTIVLFFGRELIIQTIFSDAYRNAIIPLSILAMNVSIIAINLFFGIPLIAWGKQKEFSIAITMGAIANIILNIILIPSYSYNGAAFATLLSESVVFCGLILLFNKFSKIKV